MGGIKIFPEKYGHQAMIPSIISRRKFRTCLRSTAVTCISSSSRKHSEHVEVLSENFEILDKHLQLLEQDTLTWPVANLETNWNRTTVVRRDRKWEDSRVSNWTKKGWKQANHLCWLTRNSCKLLLLPSSAEFRNWQALANVRNVLE